MTREQSGQLVALLSAAFSQPPMTEERLALFTDEIALLHDYDTALEAIRAVTREGKWFPTIKDIRAAYRAVADKRAGDEERRLRGRMIESPLHEVPAWVQVWAWSRWVRVPPETRALPQQKPGYAVTFETGDRVPTYLAPEEYERLEQEWREAGAPKWQAKQIVKQMTRAMA